MAAFLTGAAIPGMAVPGVAIPGSTGTGISVVTYLYLGHVPATYLDYLDVITGLTLTVAPGGSYAMIPVNSRAGLTVPPPDNCWLTGSNHFAPRIMHLAAAEDGAVQLARARAHSARLHAQWARGERAA